MRTLLSIVLDLAGIAALVVGGWWLAPWVGLVVLGLGCMVLAWAIDPPKRTVYEIAPEQEPEDESEPQSAVAPPPGLDWGAP